MFVAAAIGFPLFLLLAVLGMARVEQRLNAPPADVVDTADPEAAFEPGPEPEPAA